MRTLRQIEAFLDAAHSLDAAIDLLSSQLGELPHSLARGRHFQWHQPEARRALLVARQSVPQALDERADPFVGRIKTLELRQLPAQRLFTTSIGEVPVSDDAMLPSK